ncbi:MAG: hypothetical protein JO061_21505 [Acidobacteriaceae bacterium]|nr:hypothetical protein [Acidobacteriaceae bacterium]
MEIHAPEHPLRSWTDILLHLGIVTIGILIALGLEGLLEWQHHQALAREARENIRNEIRDNREELVSGLRGILENQKNQYAALRYINDALAHRKLSGKLEIGWHLLSILNSSWTTAQALGALSFMPYAEVKKYAEVYDLQSDFVRLQNEAVQRTVESIGSIGTSKDPSTMPANELQTAKGRVEAAIAAGIAEQQLGNGLKQAYDEVLKEK